MTWKRLFRKYLCTFIKISDNFEIGFLKAWQLLLTYYRGLFKLDNCPCSFLRFEALPNLTYYKTNKFQSFSIAFVIVPKRVGVQSKWFGTSLLKQLSKVMHSSSAHFCSRFSPQLWLPVGGANNYSDYVTVGHIVVK